MSVDLATELWKDGVSVITICAGPSNTESFQAGPGADSQMFTGRGVAKLIAAPKEVRTALSGRIVHGAELAEHFGIKDVEQNVANKPGTQIVRDADGKTKDVDEIPGAKLCVNVRKALNNEVLLQYQLPEGWAPGRSDPKAFEPLQDPMAKVLQLF